LFQGFGAVQEGTGWLGFEVVDLDGRRIDKVLAIPPKVKGDAR
jgi:hypothetical protein